MAYHLEKERDKLAQQVSSIHNDTNEQFFNVLVYVVVSTFQFNSNIHANVQLIKQSDTSVDVFEWCSKPPTVLIL